MRPLPTRELSGFRNIKELHPITKIPWRSEEFPGADSKTHLPSLHMTLYLGMKRRTGI